MENEAKDFFLFFAKFEYALKNSDFVKYDKKRAKPDWEKFKKMTKIPSSINSDEDVKYLKKNPPKVQCYDDTSKRLIWNERKKINDTSELIDACLTIRNNLFHGGKCNDSDNIRNMSLLNSAKKILEALLEENTELKRKFDDATLSN